MTDGSIAFLRACVPIALTAALAGCGGGGGTHGGGISGTSLRVGPISDFGSVVVDGIAFDTVDAIITLEGDLATVDDLRLGMVVTVRGTVDERRMTGVAERVAFEDLLEGPVEGVNLADGTFVTLSHLVITGTDTVFDQTTLATLVPGEVVEVSGFYDADGSVRATRVEKKVSGAEIEIKGTIAGLDELARTFRIDLLTIDYGMALIENPPPGGLADGLFVECEAEVAPVDDRFLAIGVEVLDQELMADVGDDVGIEGFVTEIVSSGEFVVNTTRRVLITPTTRFVGGDEGDIVLNAAVDVDGFIDAADALVAQEVEFLAAP